jgi:iturin family lipopeptide synthetase A
VAKGGGETGYSGLEIAVIGMAGRFPGANDIDGFWQNLQNGVESVTFFSDEELLEAGIDRSLVEHPNYVKAKRSVEGKEYFDSSFFGYLPDEARTLDPQVRVFHECVWEVLEDAGYNPAKYRGLIGLFAGAKANINWEAYVIVSQGTTSVDSFTAAQLRNKDFLPTLISYKLNLTGPAVYVYTACSTSLVAVHLACRSLLMGECQLALAGGVTLSHSAISGYLYQEGMISSADGYCRAFDAHAGGTVGGDGAAVVALKRLKNAVADGDHISAVIKGSAINNDGDRKMGFTAPSVDGQAETLRAAFKMSRLEPRSIGYVETHGTGTALGDPIEIEALIQVFGKTREKYCALGALKTNIGHLDTAAGAAGFIKTVLALKHRQLPSTLHFRQPNPKIDFENSPFYVNTGLKKWENDRHPLRAGVSSFGIGGTNAHVILEEPPEPEPSSAGGEYQLLLLSAKGSSALDRLTGRFGDFLARNADINLADAAYTLQVGRGEFSHRRMLVCRDIDEAVGILTNPESDRLKTYTVRVESRSIVFMFPGGGSQYVNMGRELYEKERVFRQEMDRCFEIYKAQVGVDLKKVLYPDTKDAAPPESPPISPGEQINQIEYTHPLLFFFEYALARLLMRWGIRPEAMIGHSSGEYAAACLSGLFSLTDAVKLVSLRGKLMQQVPPGAMLSVSLSEEELVSLLPESRELSLAAVNAPSLCVVSGPCAAVAELEEQLKQEGVEHRRLHISHAAHSKMMEPILPEFAGVFNAITFNKPTIPYISNLTGRPAEFEEISSSHYWCRHLRETVRFADGLKHLLKNKNALFVEVGPGKALSTFVRRFEAEDGGRRVNHLIRHPQEQVSDLRYLLNRIGTLWLHGVSPDWHGFYGDERRRRLSLPTYPFEKIKYPLGMSAAQIVSRINPGAAGVKRTEVADWFYVPSWKRSLLLPTDEEKSEERGTYLFFMDDCGLGSGLRHRVEEQGGTVAVVRRGTAFAETSAASFSVCPQSEADYVKLFRRLADTGCLPAKIVHMWNVTNSGLKSAETLDRQRVQEAQYSGFYSLLNIAKAIGGQRLMTGIDIHVISDGLQDVNGSERLAPEKSTVLGAVKVIPQEYNHISCRSIDVDLAEGGGRNRDRLLDQLYEELTHPTSDQVIGYRGPHRWVETFEPVKLAKADEIPAVLRAGGVYLITGGLGGMGLAFAEYLSSTVKPRLILTGRRRLPQKGEWQTWLGEADPQDNTSQIIHKLLGLEEMGAEILYLQADVADLQGMERGISEAEEQLGPINGIIHTAGVADYAGVIQQRSFGENEEVFAAKIYGLLTLEQLTRGRQLDFLFICSSLAGIIGLFGQVGYCAANLFQDAFARYQSRTAGNGTFVQSIGWDSWQEVGMAAAAAKRRQGQPGGKQAIHTGMKPEEGVEVFRRALCHLSRRLSYLAVSTRELTAMLTNGRQLEESDDSLTDRPQVPEVAVDRPALTTTYVEPSTTTEEALARIWQGFFGISQIGINDDFFELGGDSLKAMTVAGIIHRELQVELLLADFFARPTIGHLAGLVDSSKTTEFARIENCEEREYYPLSSAQKRLYVLQQMAPKSTAYNLPVFIPVKGDIDGEQLEATFKQVINRHESLRTSFEMVGEEPVQKIHRQVAFKVEYEYLAAGRGQTVKEDPGHSPQTLQDFIRPFDLSQAPLLRVVLIKGESSVPRLFLDIHHIITDGVSQTILIDDFKALHGGEARPHLRLQYRDYVRWQNSAGQQDLMKAQESYWLQIFSDEIPVLNVPIDYPRPFIQSFEGSLVEFVLSEEESRRLREMASREGVTLFMTILSIFTVLLSKLSGQQDIVVGTPTAGRRHADLGQIVGMFVNTLALRNYPHGDRSFRQLLAEVRERTLQAFENQAYQFEDLVDRLAVPRDTGRNPLFDVMFNMLNQWEFSGELPKKSDEGSYRHKKGISKFDLTLAAVEFEREILCYFEYCTKLFKPAAIERMIAYFKKVIHVLAKRPDCKISEIEIIGQAEKNRILHEFNKAGMIDPAGKTIQALFEARVEQRADNIVLICGARQLTYSALNGLANQLAQLLRGMGVGPDGIAAVRANRSPETIVAMLAALKAGGGYLPIDPNYPGLRQKYMIEDSRAFTLLVPGDAGADTGTVPTDFPRERVVFLDDGASFPGPTANLEMVSGSRNLAYVIYTSGTTGRPRGVMVEHRALVHFIYAMSENFDNDFSCRDRCLSLTNFCFDVSVCEIFMPLVWGAAVVVLAYDRIFDPQVLAGTILSNMITFAYIPPSLLGLIGERLASSAEGLILNKMLVGVEPIQDHTLEDYLRLNREMRIVNGYGPTEATICATAFRYRSQEPTGSRVPIGLPLGNNEVYLLDRYSHLVPVGVPGELCIAGDGLARGYLNNPDLTADKFMNLAAKVRQDTRSPTYQSLPPKSQILYKTGDLSRWLADGNILFLGRIDTQVKIRGLRVELGEIESQLLTHESIKAVVVLARESHLCVYFVSTVELSPVDLREYLARRLPDYMIPSYFVELAEIPLTANGKVDRKALPEPEFAAGTDEAAPTNEIEEKLAKIWCGVLGIEEDALGIDTNFFTAGGHSLKAVIMTARVHKEMEVRIPLEQVFKTPTIRELARYVKSSVREEFLSLEPVEKREYYILSSAQKRLYILQQMEPESTAYHIAQTVVLDFALDKESLAQNFRQLMARHQSFRTAFTMVGEEPVQRIWERVDFDIEYHDLVESKREPLTGPEERIIKDFIRPFDLSRPPLLRVGLIRLKENKYILMKDMHHIVSDGLSMELLVRDFRTLLRGDNLPPLPIQYKDFAVWQNSETMRHKIENQQDYWLKEFSGDIPVLNLPTDYPRPVVQSFAGRNFRFEIGKEDTGRLKDLAAEAGVTLYILLLTVFYILLSKLGDQEDIVVGTPIAGRRHTDLERIIGMFVNTLALRNFPAADRSFKDFLDEVKRRTLQAFENQDFQFEGLVERVMDTRDTGRNPLFDVMFELVTIDAPAGGQPEPKESGESTNYRFRDQKSKFDMTLRGIQRGDNLNFNITYNVGLFRPETIERFVGYFQKIIAAVLEYREIKLKDIRVYRELLDKKLNVPRMDIKF